MGIKASAVLPNWSVGAIFLSTVATNPSILLGFGSWEGFGRGRVLVGLDDTDPDFDTLGEVGGEKSHTLTVAEIPAHDHSYTAPAAPQNSRLVGLLSSVDGTNAATTGQTGGGGAHNNLQPYIVVHMWRRVA